MKRNSLISQMLLLLCSTVLTVFAGTQAGAQTIKADKTLWYDRPAAQWEETLPLGNGRLGMMPDGGISKEHIVLNEISM